MAVPLDLVTPVSPVHNSGHLNCRRKETQLIFVLFLFLLVQETQAFPSHSQHAATVPAQITAEGKGVLDLTDLANSISCKAQLCVSTDLPTFPAFTPPTPQSRGKLPSTWSTGPAWFQGLTQGRAHRQDKKAGDSD